jgi:hypothetical protein
MCEFFWQEMQMARLSKVVVMVNEKLNLMGNISFLSKHEFLMSFLTHMYTYGGFIKCKSLLFTLIIRLFIFSPLPSYCKGIYEL